MRLYKITTHNFLFYDEGMYLGYNRPFLDLVAANPPKNLNELLIILGLIFKAALNTPKSLWFFMLNLRVFFVGVEGWYWARVISAAAGLLTVGLTYVWAKRYFQSKEIAFLSAVILSVLPSHVFYSRLGMQESLSALLFLSGMYIYVFSPRGLNIKVALSSVLLAAVYFTNYRMIIAPLFIILAQIWADCANKQKIDIQKIIWSCLFFAIIIFGFGSLYGGANTYVTFGWMVHQADESHAHRHLINFLSFPYYLFALEGIVFSIFFFSNFYWFAKRQWKEILPFVVVLAQMFLFSFAAEKGARYLCVVLPFMAIASAYSIVQFKDLTLKYYKIFLVVVGIMFLGLISTSFMLARAKTDYAQAVAMVLAHDAQAKIISTQPLFVHDERVIVDCPKEPVRLAELISLGYRYLFIDPQAYISWTAGGERFTDHLLGYLEQIQGHLQPVAILPHIEGVLLERFVLDHNQDLFTSLKFLSNRKDKGQIYIYDLHQQP